MQWIHADALPPNPLACDVMLNTDMCLALLSGNLAGPVGRLTWRESLEFRRALGNGGAD